MSDEVVRGRGELPSARNIGHFRAHERRPLPKPTMVSCTRLSERAHGPRPSGANAEPGLQAALIDIGVGGACLELDALLGVGEAVSLALSTPHRWEPLVVPATVAWARANVAGKPSRAGVAFAYPGSAELLDVVSLLATLA